MPKVGDIIRAEDFKTNGGYIGQIIEFPSNLIPSNTLLCDGSEISRDTYSELFSVINTIYGEGDGSTTFNIPDYRGTFLRCTGGNAAELGTAQGDAIRNITGQVSVRPGAQSTTTIISANGAFSINLDGGSSAGSGYSGGGGSPKADILLFSAADIVPTANENRPVNYAVNVCIIYE